MRTRFEKGTLVVLFLAVFLGGVLFFKGEVEGAFEEVPYNSCIDCHTGLPDKRLSQPVSLWAKSVHAEVGNTCDGCHGGDSKDKTVNAMSKSHQFYAAPAEDEIVSFCGKCHQELSENFMTSAHGQTGTQNCIGCHGSHTIQRISIEMINEKKCGECHGYGEPEKLKNILQGLHGRFQGLNEKLKLVSGFPTEPVQNELDKVWKKLRQVRMISHTFDIPRIQAESQQVEKLLGTTDSEIQRLLDMAKNRRSWGYWMVFVFSVLAVLTYIYNRQIKT